MEAVNDDYSLEEGIAATKIQGAFRRNSIKVKVNNKKAEQLTTSKYSTIIMGFI